MKACFILCQVSGLVRNLIVVKLSLSAIEGLANVGGYAGLSFLSQKTAATLLSVAVWLSDVGNWDGSGYVLSDSEIDRIKKLVASLEYEVMQSAVGMVISSVTQECLPGTLWCDGALYLRVDYPELYGAIHSNFHVDANSFNVPDMRGCFPRCTTTANQVGSVGGTETETLTTSQMPIHRHGLLQFQNVPLLEGAGIPYPLAVSGPQLPTITDNSGGGQSHNNLPPFFTVGYLIVAGRS